MTRGRWRIGGLRGRLLASVLVAMGLLLAVLTLAFNLVLAGRLDSDARGVAQARAAAGLSGLEVSGGRIQRSEAPDEHSPDIQLWVFQGTRQIERPRNASAQLDTVARALAAVAPAHRDVQPALMRLYSLPVVQAGRTAGAVVAALSLAPYEQTRHTALVGSLLLALIAFIAVAVAARWLISKALSPVARMTRQAGEWSEQDLDRRFGLGRPRDELTELAFTLDGLLDRLAATLRHEQRLSAELSHELRTPLASIAAEAQFALRHVARSDEVRLALQSIHECALRMGRTLETLIAAAQVQLDPHRATSDAAKAARAAIEAVEAVAGRDVATSVDVSAPGVRVAVEQGLVERILAPLLDNAHRHATARVQVTVRRGSQGVVLTVSDDGAGIDGDELEAVFEPGRRTRGSVAVSNGAGLGLSLARRLARSAGGDVRAEESDGGGRFTVQLPPA